MIRAKRHSRKKLRSGFWLLAALTFSSSLVAQNVSYRDILNSTEVTDFQQLTNEIDIMYDNNGGEEGSSYKQYQRWKYFFKNRLDNGQLTNWWGHTWINYETSKRDIEGNGPDEAEWSELGYNLYTNGPGLNPGTGRVVCIEEDPHNPGDIYLGTPAGGIWKRANGTTNWVPLGDDLPSIGVSDIAFDYQNPGVIYIATGDAETGGVNSMGVYKSTDGGLTWNPTSLTFNQSQDVDCFKLVIHPTNPQVLLLATSQGLYRTEDGFTSQGFTNIMHPGRIVDIEFRPNTPQVVYIAEDGQYNSSGNHQSARVWKSTDHGQIFTQIDPVANNLGLNFFRIELAVTPADPSTIYVLQGGAWYDDDVSGYRYSGLWRSTNDGATFWFRSKQPNVFARQPNGHNSDHQTSRDLEITVSPTNKDHVFVGGNGTRYSTDGGVNWNYMANSSLWYNAPVDYKHGDAACYEWLSDGNLYAGNDGGIYVSTNQGINWTDISNDLRISQVYHLAVDPHNTLRFINGCQDIGSNSYEGFSQNYRHIGGGDGGGCLYHPSDPNISYYTANQGRIYRSTNGGLSYTAISSSAAPHGQNFGGHLITPIAQVPNQDDKVYVGGKELYEVHYTNSSSSPTVTQVGMMPNTAGPVDDFAVIEQNTNIIIYMAVKGLLYRSVNGGSSWSNCNYQGGQIDQVTDIEINSTNPDEVWVTTGHINGSGNVFYSTDGGNTWTDISGHLPKISANCVVHRPGTNGEIYVGMDVGVYFYDNTIQLWRLYKNGLPNSPVTDLKIDATEKKLYASTYGRGVWISDLFYHCDPTVVLNNSNPTSGNYKFEAGDELFSTQDLGSGDIRYRAANRVVLEEGFSSGNATSGIYFKALLGDCGMTQWREGVQPVAESNPIDELAPQLAVDPATRHLSAFPNPTVNDYQVRFEIPTQKKLTLKIYDLTGRQMETLFESRQFDEGTHQLTFNSSKLPNGLYILQLSSENDQHQTRLLVQH